MKYKRSSPVVVNLLLNIILWRTYSMAYKIWICEFLQKSISHIFVTNRKKLPCQITGAMTFSNFLRYDFVIEKATPQKVR